MLGFKDDIDKALCRKEASIAHILLGWDFQSGRYTLHTMLSKKYDKLGILHEAKDRVMEETRYSHLFIKVKKSDINRVNVSSRG